MDIVVTIPKSTEWEVYEKELDAAALGETMRFKVSSLPKRSSVGDRCYVVWDGLVRGWMRISGFYEGKFRCTTTGRIWRGKFIERTGHFTRLEEPIPYLGFQGWRYFEAPT